MRNRKELNGITKRKKKHQKMGLCLYKHFFLLIGRDALHIISSQCSFVSSFHRRHHRQEECQYIRWRKLLLLPFSLHGSGLSISKCCCLECSLSEINNADPAPPLEVLVEPEGRRIDVTIGADFARQNSFSCGIYGELVTRTQKKDLQRV